jgi:hypothetical protein
VDLCLYLNRFHLLEAVFSLGFTVVRICIFIIALGSSWNQLDHRLPRTKNTFNDFRLQLWQDILLHRPKEWALYMVGTSNVYRFLLHGHWFYIVIPHLQGSRSVTESRDLKEIWETGPHFADDPHHPHQKMPSGYVNRLLLKMAIELVDFPIKNGDVIIAT